MLDARRVALEQAWPLLLAGERGRAIAAAQEVGMADKEMPRGTKIRVEGYGDGTYEGFESHWIGANTHTVMFASGPRELMLRDMKWSVTAPALATASTSAPQQ